MIFSSVLTANRVCNFRCPWCYAEGTKYLKSDDMELAKNLVDFSRELGVRSIALIGGEPTYYPQIFELIEYIDSMSIQTMLVSNGFRFKDSCFVKEMDKFQNLMLTFSLKGATKDQYIQLTKVDAFSDTVQAIKNLKDAKNIKTGYSTVVSKNTVYDMVDYARLISELDDKKSLKYSFCNGIKWDN